MRLEQARVQNYRSIRDTGWFDVEDAKTILVGPNEAGKTALLEALQQINPSDDARGFDPLRDYPRKLYNADIQSRRLQSSAIPVASARFRLEPDDVAALPEGFEEVSYRCTRYLDNHFDHQIEGGPEPVVFSEEVREDLRGMASHIDQQTVHDREPDEPPPSATLTAIIGDWSVNETTIDDDNAAELEYWLDSIEGDIDEDDVAEVNRYERLYAYIVGNAVRSSALATLKSRLPVFVYFADYFRVRPNLHLRRFADRTEQNLLDDDRYDYGNLCLLKLLGFTARRLAELGEARDPGDDPDAFENYRSQLDERRIQLNAASTRLTDQVGSVWNPDGGRAEADTLRVQADGQYLKVVVEDELGVEVEFDQRSAGFQWLVSFFVVFFAEAEDAHANAILLLDEPGLSLHGLKQREFRKTVSRLAKSNQTMYTTHSPFLVGPDELDLVRVVEMTDRDTGTQVHTNVTASDPAALLPLQEALGYDLAQSLFAQQRNLVLEGLTDYWYFEATAQLLREGGVVDLNEKIALHFAKSASKVVYYATILHANNLRVAAVLDSDNAGDTAAQQDALVHTLGNRKILRTGEFCPGSIAESEIEDLLRATLIGMAKSELGWDITATAASQPNRPIVDIFSDEVPNFSKYRLAKAYVRWTREHTATDLTSDERQSWKAFVGKVNKALR